MVTYYGLSCRGSLVLKKMFKKFPVAFKILHNNNPPVGCHKLIRGKINLPKDLLILIKDVFDLLKVEP